MFHAFLSSSDFLKSTFSNNTIRVSNSLDPHWADVFFGVQTVCKGYQQMTLVGRELIKLHSEW